MATDSGEVKNAKEVGKIMVTYTEYREEGTGNLCTTSGHISGEILTTVAGLKGRVGYVLPLVVDSKGTMKVGVELESESGKVFAEFTCTGVAGKVIVEGCTIGEATPLNVSQKAGELVFEVSGGKQLYTEIEGGVNKPCELSVTATSSN